MGQETNLSDKKRQKSLVILSGVSVAIFLGIASTGEFNQKKKSPPAAEFTEAPTALETGSAGTAAVETVVVETSPPSLSNATRIESAHNAPVRAVEWSPDGSRFASGGGEPDKDIYVWDATSLKKLSTLKYTGGGDATYLVRWSPDNSMIASTNFERSVRVYDVKTGELVKEFSGHTDIVESVAWSPDGKRLASVGWDESLRIWSLSDATETTFVAQGPPMYSVAWSPDGTQLVTGGDNGDVSVGSLTESPGVVRIWDVTTGLPTKSFTEAVGAISSVAWSPDGTSIAMGGLEGKVRVWSPANNVIDVVSDEKGWVRKVDWSSAGQLAYGTEAGRVSIWSKPGGIRKQAGITHQGPVLSLSWSPDGTKIVSCGQDKSIAITIVK
jgi:WD40 repeat protein